MRSVWTDANRERDRRDHDDERESGAGELVGEPVPVEIERDPDRPDAREHDEQRNGHAPVEDVALGGAEHPGEREEADDGERRRDREELERTGPAAVSGRDPRAERGAPAGISSHAGDAPSTVFVIELSSMVTTEPRRRHLELLGEDARRRPCPERRLVGAGERVGERPQVGLVHELLMTGGIQMITKREQRPQCRTASTSSSARPA